MKTFKYLLFFFIGFFLISESVLGQKKAGVEFFHGSWDELLVEAKKTGKPFFIDFWASWCGPCKLLNKTTFLDEEVGKIANLYFIPYKLSTEQGDGKLLAGKYNIRSIPTIIFFDSKGNEIGRVMGYHSASQFIPVLNKYADKKAVSNKKKGKSKSASYDDFITETAESYAKLDEKAIEDDSLRKLMLEFKQLGSRKEDLIRDDILMELKNSSFYQYSWLFNAYYHIGAEQYKEATSIIHKKFENKEINSLLLHWLCYQYLEFDLKDIPSETMQWINFLLREKTDLSYYNTKVALLFKDEKYNLAEDVCKEALKYAKSNELDATSIEIMLELAKDENKKS